MSTLCSVYIVEVVYLLHTIMHNLSFFSFSFPCHYTSHGERLIRFTDVSRGFFNDYLQLQILFNDKLMIKLNKRISSQERNGDKKIKKKKRANNLYLFIDLL